MRRSYNYIIAILIGLLMFQFYLIGRLLEPEQDRQCIPLYDETGYECCAYETR